ncbi:hypothetical protein [Paracraurococcus ruber]|uniref:Uncharacterized protein n=1 Tax=Paracraurococcus ruber TaxID=77675 RepID=A0ABS1CQY0_9PROT|nr:hypothetical protein [Paracraurococcus ruber]MBK1656828.1 hypothetical protein [Paracraurococcus ruber]TDG33944.1 hypothetical protein E2C05_01500 [Paracraurococcus ruber]
MASALPASNTADVMEEFDIALQEELGGVQDDQAYLLALLKELAVLSEFFDRLEAEDLILLARARIDQQLTATLN